MRVGIIGLGAIAPMHVNALLDCGQSIVALCDIEIEKCREIKEQFSCEKELQNAEEYSDYKEMLDKANLDAVHICTPHYLHAEMICESLSRDINVLCEKPLAISFAQFDEIEKAVKASKAKLGISFQNRYNPTVITLKNYIADKKVTCGTANLVWKRDEKYYASGEWRGKMATEGGGVMINQAIHSLDILQWLCGMPESVLAHVSNNSLKDTIEVEDTAFGIFSLENGRNFVVHATNAAKSSFPVYMAFNSGSDTIELSADNLIVNGNFVTKENGEPIFGKTEWGSGHAILIREYYEALKNGEKFPIDFYEARNSIRLILKMYESNGSKINIKN